MINKNIFINILLALISPILVLVILIFSVDIFYSYGQEKNWHDVNTRFDSKLGWAPIPNTRMIDKKGRMISSNSLGFRSAEIDPAESQIILSGDSVAWGLTLSDDQTISYFLSKKVPSKYQITNMAVSGYGFDQSYLFLKRHIDKLGKIDRIILIICSENDVKDTSGNFAYGRKKPLYILRKDGELELTGTPIFKYCLKNWTSISYFYKRFLMPHRRIHQFVSKRMGDKQFEHDQAFKVSTVLIRKISDLASSHSAKFTILLSPDRGDFVKKSRELLALEDYLNSTSYDFVDYFEWLKKQKNPKSFYVDFVHYSARGNELLADVIYQRLKDQGLN